MKRREFLSRVGLGSLAGYSLVVLADDQPLVASEGRSADEIRQELARIAPKGDRTASPNEPHMTHVKPGKSGEIVWQFTRPGEFQFACLLPGHFEAGMVGKVTVK